MALKKSELYSSLWRSCDELRGGMDASQYKDYVLVMLFMKYVTDRYAGDPDAPILVPDGASFKDFVALRGNKNIGEEMNKIIFKLAEANDLVGVITVADFNDPDKLGKDREMVDRLSNLVGIFDNPALNFSKNNAEGDDLLGDAYEYLMRHFATESGKSKGQFYTPAEVSRIMARVIGMESVTSANQTIYDPTCGSGSLLLKAAAQAPTSITIYGQEMDNATRALAKMNMILHGHPGADIVQGNTLATPHWTENGKLKTFDHVVANPPFSTKAWSSGVNTEQDPYERFKYGMPPVKNGDYAFLLHILASLKSQGAGAVILPHGVLFRGNAEASIRKNLIQRGYIKGIIGLPANLFYGTGIPACIIILDKKDASSRRGIFMIDASKGYAKDGNKNRLRHQDVHRIVDVFNNQHEIPHYARMVPTSEILNDKNDGNLNIPRYIENGDREDLQDIEAHLRGGLPERDIDALEPYWNTLPALRETLFNPADRPGYHTLRVPTTNLKTTILDHPQFKEYADTVHTTLADWTQRHTPTLIGLQQGSDPKTLLRTLSEDILITYQHTALLDPYDLYQHFMTYWDNTMQDDTYLIAASGWKEAATLRLLLPMTDDKGKAKYTEEAHFTTGTRATQKRYVADLIPPHLIITRYYPNEQAKVDLLLAEAENTRREIEELEEEHGNEGGLLEDAVGDNGKFSAATSRKYIKNRLSDIVSVADTDAREETALLMKYARLLDQADVVSKAAKKAQDALTEKVFARYAQLTEDEIKQLVVHDKWLTALTSGVEGELNRVTGTLTNRVRELAERYAQPLPMLAHNVETLEAKVNAHLQKMGFTWP